MSLPREFIATALAAGLWVAPVSAAEAQEYTPVYGEPDKPVSTLTASDETMATYGELLGVVKSRMPNDFKLLVITAQDIASPEDIATLQNFVANADPAIMSACAPEIPEDQKDTATREAEQIIEKAAQNVAALLKEHAQSGAFILPQELTAMQNNDPEEYQENLMAIAAATILQEAAAFSLTSQLGINSKAAIVMMPNELTAPSEFATLYSGLLPDYLTNINSTAKDLALYTLGHEGNGHAAHNHNRNPDLDGEYCASVDINFLHQVSSEEAMSDAEGSITYRFGQWQGVASSANTPQEIEHIRALGAIYLNLNEYAEVKTEMINTHWTTLGFQSDRLNFTSNINIPNTYETFSTPLTVNTFADALSGLLHAQDHFQQSPDAIEPTTGYTAANITQVRELLSDPHHFANLAMLGVNKRLSDQKAEYHYAAMDYLKESGTFDALRESFPAQYQPILDDLLTDFFEATAAHGSEKLIDQALIARLKTTLDNNNINAENLMTAYLTPIDEAANDLGVPALSQ